jgi:hypothetical protein
MVEPPHPDADPSESPPPLALRPLRPQRPPKAPGAYLRLPLWARFALAALIALSLVVALVLYVDRHNTNSPPSTNPAAEVSANHEAEILVAQDQAPHVVRLAPGLHAQAALTHAVRADMHGRISRGALEGPLQRARCQPTGPARGSRRAFSCNVLAGSVGYPFEGVVDLSTRQVTYCKRDPPPAPSDNVPVSPRCRP